MLRRQAQDRAMSARPEHFLDRITELGDRTRMNQQLRQGVIDARTLFEQHLIKTTFDKEF
jgi:hypothetical protein